MICDLVEVYRIYDYHSMAVKTLGILCAGLGPDSRIGMKIAKRSASRRDILLAMLRDELSDILWVLSTSGKDEESRPEHITPLLYENQEKQKEELESYGNGADFDAARDKIMRRIR